MTHPPITNVYANEQILAGPEKVLTKRKVSLLTATMPTCRRIMKFKHDVQTLIVMRGSAVTRCVVDNGGIVQNPVAIPIPIQIGTILCQKICLSYMKWIDEIIHQT